MQLLLFAIGVMGVLAGLLSVSPWWLRLLLLLTLLTVSIHAFVAWAIRRRDFDREKEERWAKFEAHVARKKAEQAKAKMDATQTTADRATTPAAAKPSRSEAAAAPPSADAADAAEPVAKLRSERQGEYLIF